jgi:hypothetical protein
MVLQQNSHPERNSGDGTLTLIAMVNLIRIGDARARQVPKSDQSLAG